MTIDHRLLKNSDGGASLPEARGVRVLSGEESMLVDLIRFMGYAEARKRLMGGALAFSATQDGAAPGE